MGKYFDIMNNPITYIRAKKKFIPTTKLKYVTGLGDLFSVIFHSKLIGPITYMITGKLEPCPSCNTRRVILNQLFPMAIWSKFFESQEDVQEDIRKEYKKEGIDYIYIDSKKTDEHNDRKNNPSPPPPPPLMNHPAYRKEGYYLLEEKRSIVENLLIETLTYKKI